MRARPPGDLAAAVPHLRHQGLGAPAELRCVEIAITHEAILLPPDNTTFYILVIVKEDGSSLEI